MSFTLHSTTTTTTTIASSTTTTTATVNDWPMIECPFQVTNIIQ